MILLSPEQVDEQIDYVLDNNDLPLEALLKPLVESASKATAKKIRRWGNSVCPHYNGTDSMIKHLCFQCWQQLKKEIEC